MPVDNRNNTAVPYGNPAQKKTNSLLKVTCSLLVGGAMLSGCGGSAETSNTTAIEAKGTNAEEIKMTYSFSEALKLSPDRIAAEEKKLDELNETLKSEAVQAEVKVHTKLQKELEPMLLELKEKAVLALDPKSLMVVEKLEEICLSRMITSSDPLKDARRYFKRPSNREYVDKLIAVTERRLGEIDAARKEFDQKSNALYAKRPSAPVEAELKKLLETTVGAYKTFNRFAKLDTEVLESLESFETTVEWLRKERDAYIAQKDEVTKARDYLKSAAAKFKALEEQTHSYKEVALACKKQREHFEKNLVKIEPLFERDFLKIYDFHISLAESLKEAKAPEGLITIYDQVTDSQAENTDHWTAIKWTSVYGSIQRKLWKRYFDAQGFSSVYDIFDASFSSENFKQKAAQFNGKELVSIVHFLTSKQLPGAGEQERRMSGLYSQRFFEDMLWVHESKDYKEGTLCALNPYRLTEKIADTKIRTYHITKLKECNANMTIQQISGMKAKLKQYATESPAEWKNWIIGEVYGELQAEQWCAWYDKKFKKTLQKLGSLRGEESAAKIKEIGFENVEALFNLFHGGRLNAKRFEEIATYSRLHEGGSAIAEDLYWVLEREKVAKDSIHLVNPYRFVRDMKHPTVAMKDHHTQMIRTMNSSRKKLDDIVRMKDIVEEDYKANPQMWQVSTEEDDDVRQELFRAYAELQGEIWSDWYDLNYDKLETRLSGSGEEERLKAIRKLGYETVYALFRLFHGGQIDSKHFGKVATTGRLMYCDQPQSEDMYWVFEAEKMTSLCPVNPYEFARKMKLDDPKLESYHLQFCRSLNTNRKEFSDLVNMKQQLEAAIKQEAAMWQKSDDEDDRLREKLLTAYSDLQSTVWQKWYDSALGKDIKKVEDCFNYHSKTLEKDRCAENLQALKKTEFQLMIQLLEKNTIDPKRFKANAGHSYTVGHDRITSPEFYRSIAPHLN